MPLPGAVKNMLGLTLPRRMVGDLILSGRVGIRSEAWFETVRGQLAGAAEEDPAAAIAILDRFQLMPVTAEGRIVLSPAIQAHIAAHEGGLVRLVVADGCLEIWSEGTWQDERAERMALTERLLANG